ncbi:MAG: FHA domain-containing protein [Polyangiaceae bacterium]|nr:FHA domain-containing protein [Polyangiaceae bacterium]
MITCPKCSKENQDHYKYCLGCGAELPRENAPKPFSPQTPPHGVPAQAAPAPAPAPVASGAPPAAAPTPYRAPAPEAAEPAPAASGQVDCPQCGHKNPPNNRFCASCGYNLGALSGSVAAAAPAAAPAAAGSGPSVVLTALRSDGSEAGSYPLPDAPTLTVGRDTGAIFAGDSYLSPRHATFLRKAGQLSIKDESSLNGVYIKLRPNEPEVLEYENVFRIGQEIIRLEPLKPQPASPDGVQRFGSPAKGYIGRLALVIGRDTTGNAFPIPERGVHCGRERGDILFSEDGYVSGLHCRIHRAEDGKIYLTDVGSSNGTFIRISGERSLTNGDILLMGQQLFRVDL